MCQYIFKEILFMLKANFTGDTERYNNTNLTN